MFRVLLTAQLTLTIPPPPSHHKRKTPYRGELKYHLYIVLAAALSGGSSFESIKTHRRAATRIRREYNIIVFSGYAPPPRVSLSTGD